MKPFAGAAVVLALLASATLTLTLLGSATLASAEDAWVLWLQDVIAVEGQAPAVTWLYWGSSTTKDGCEDQRRKELEHFEQMSKLYPTDWVKQGDVILAKDKGKVVRRTSYYCYASTINPRWELLTTDKNWYLMGPPRTNYDATAAYLRGIQVLRDRALSQWNLLDAHDSRQECEIMRDVRRRAEQSIYITNRRQIIFRRWGSNLRYQHSSGTWLRCTRRTSEPMSRAAASVVMTLDFPVG